MTLQALSEGREWQLLEPQLLAPKGYRLLQCCHMAMEQLQKALALHQHTADTSPTGSRSSASAATAADKQGITAGSNKQTDAAGAAAGGDLQTAARLAVGFMCEGRLVPTTWLNEVSG